MPEHYVQRFLDHANLHVTVEIQTPRWSKVNVCGAGIDRPKFPARTAVRNTSASARASSLARQMTTGMTVEAEPIVRPRMLEVEMPPVVALGPQTARTAADLAESVVVMAFHLVPPFPPSQHRRHRSRPC